MSKKKSDRSTSSADERQAAKKAAVLGTEKKNRLPLLITILACAVVFILAGVFFFRGSGETASVVASTDTVSYPVGTFEDGKARHYQLKPGEGTPVKFFILKSSDGVIRAAFDACDVCWKAGLGYYQEGDVMVCKNCGQRFASVKVNEVRGGCNPAPLNREIVGDQLVIKVKDILDGKRYFDIPGRS
ncbi:MAG: DUF2318 domain-containing protein [Desulfobacterales bacterium]|nr:DUF2318 domain-containing protein [Desulfobacterales bacterium]